MWQRSKHAAPLLQMQQIKSKVQSWLTRCDLTGGQQPESMWYRPGSTSKDGIEVTGIQSLHQGTVLIPGMQAHGVHGRQPRVRI